MKNIFHMQVLTGLVYEYYFINYVEVMYMCIPLCGLGFTWERVNPYMSLCLVTMNQQNSGTTGLDRGEATIWMKNLLVDIMRAICAIND